VDGQVGGLFDYTMPLTRDEKMIKREAMMILLLFGPHEAAP